MSDDSTQQEATPRRSWSDPVLGLTAGQWQTIALTAVVGGLLLFFTLRPVI